MKNTVQKIIFAMVLAMIVLPNFAFAQASFEVMPAPAPKAATRTTVTSQMVLDARNNEAACNTLSYNIYNMRLTPGPGNYLAQWFQDKDGVFSCRFVRIYNTFQNGTVRVQQDQAAINTWNSYAVSDTKAITTFEKTSSTTDAAQVAYNEKQKESAGPGSVIGFILNSVLSAVTAFVLLITATLGSVFTIAINWILS